MSKVVTRYLLFCVSVVQIFCISAAAQNSKPAAKVTIEITAASKINISGEFISSRKRPKSLSFELSAAGFDGLGERIKALRLTNGKDEEIKYKTFIPGEYLADVDITGWSYQIDLSPRKEKKSAAHISWASKTTAVLMLGDLLPQAEGEMFIELKLPKGWNSIGGGKIEDAARSVVIAASGLRTQNITTPKGGKIAITTIGEWRFTDAESAEFAQQIFDSYSDLFGTMPVGQINVNILPFPEKTGFGEWQAETRGRNVTIISSDMAFSTQSVQRLHEQLRHEVFHLWMPNLIKLNGSYDWFYEGFALYESLKLGLALNRISFADYLDTLSRAATIDAFQTNRTSLIEASKSRKIGSDTFIYARGMLTAFLCDAAMLERSKGKKPVETILRSLFEKASKTETLDANEVIVGVMSERPELVPVVKKYIEGNEYLDITPAMSAIGLENIGEGKRVSLKVLKKPSGRQKEILNKLGYNNWRKLSPNRK